MKLKWDQDGERVYETGVRNGVLYPAVSGAYPNGVAWNGLTAVTESPSGAEATAIYADDAKYLSLLSAEEFGASIEAYTYPEEFEACDGSASLANGISIGQQPRQMFGVAYRTTVGNDTEGENYGYKLHLIYGCKASPSEKAYQTINDSPEAITFSWEITTTPVAVTGHKVTANVTIDSTKMTEAQKAKLADLEDILYGVDAEEFSASKTYKVGDYCTYTASSETAAKTYKCTTAVETPGAWDADNWTEITKPGPRLPLPDEIATMFAA